MSGLTINRRNIIEVPESYTSFGLRDTYQVPANKYADIELDVSSTYLRDGGTYSGLFLTANMGRINGTIKCAVKNDFYDVFGGATPNSTPHRFKIQTDPQGKAKVRLKAGDTIKINYVALVTEVDTVTITINDLLGTASPAIAPDEFSIPGINLTTNYVIYSLSHVGTLTFNPSTSLITFSHSAANVAVGVGDPRIFASYWQPVININNVNITPIGNTAHVLAWVAGRQNPGDPASHSGRINAGTWTQTFPMNINTGRTNANMVTLYDLPKNNLLTSDIEGN